MNDRNALLEAIFAAPDDDAPRLIYADWLDEHDEPAQAAWIRYQIDCFRDGIFDHPDHVRLFGELLMELPSSRMFERPLNVEYSRGLPRNFDTTVTEAESYSANWWPRFPLTGLTLLLTPMNVRTFVQIPYLSRLKSLVLNGEDPHGLIVPVLVKCRPLKGLETLDLSNFTLGIEAAVTLSSTDIFLNLKELRMPHTMRPNREAGRMLRNRYGDVCIM
jgi:uncharacterized protein (TIGR02996 family)